MIKVGFLGFGNMAMAIVEGWNNYDLRQKVDVYAYAPHQEKLQANCQRLQSHACRTPLELVQNVEVLILACKPYQVESVLDSIQGELLNHLVISLAAGIDYEKLSGWLKDIHHVSIMPNTAIAAGAGTVIVEEKNTMDQHDQQLLHELFAPVAYVQPIDSSLFSIAGTISGCSPAFLGLYAEALADAGVKYGLTRPVAARLAAQAIYGAGAMLKEDGKEPSVFKNDICSPGGTTIKGIVTLEKDGFRKAVIEAIEAIQQ